MYIVNKYHYRPAYIKGDLEDETIMVYSVYSCPFKTRKEAKDYIEKELGGKSDVYRYYHKGNKISYCGYLTGKTWVHENTGETCEESFRYELFKKKIK